MAAPSHLNLFSPETLMLAIAQATIIAGYRARSVHAAFLLMVILALGSWMAGEFAARAPATVTMDVGISLTRFILMILALLWAQDFFAKDIEKKTVYSLLAQPISRSGYFMGRYLGVSILLAITLIALSITLAVMVWLATNDYSGQRAPDLGFSYLIVITYIYVDTLVLLSFVWALTSLSTTPLLPFGLGLIFAWSTHSLGPALNYLESGSQEAIRLTHAFHPLLDAIRWIFPDLSQLDIRHLALYDLPLQQLSGATNALMLAICYIILMLAITRAIFERREFD